MVPLQFYFVKKNAEPKAKPRELVTSADIIYLIALGVFIATFVVLSRQTIQETTIEVSDISGDGYTCSMASVISSSIQLDTNEPAEFYDLINVNELGADCVSDLQSAQPCNSSQIVYQPVGNSTSYNLLTQSSSAYSTSIVYLVVYPDGIEAEDA